MRESTHFKDLLKVLAILSALCLLPILACSLPDRSLVEEDDFDQEQDDQPGQPAASIQSACYEQNQALAASASPLDSGLSGVKHWLYLIDVDLDEGVVHQIEDSGHDLVVLDFIPSEKENTDYPMGDVVRRLHNASHPKLVLAYIDIGEAEDYRTYWQSGWRVGNPDWIAGDDPDGWAGNYPVAFWREAWQQIWIGPEGYLQELLDLGFDGVYLDWVEAYSDEVVLDIAVKDHIDPRREMIEFICEMAVFTRAQQEGFILIAQNAAELAQNDNYVQIIDGIAQEQVWFDGGADNDPPGDCPLPRTEAEVDSSSYAKSLSPKCRQQYEDYPDSTLHVSSAAYLEDLTAAQEKGLVIFTVDYALDPVNVDWVYETSRGLGFIPFVGSRALDGFIAVHR